MNWNRLSDVSLVLRGLRRHRRPVNCRRSAPCPEPWRHELLTVINDGFVLPANGGPQAITAGPNGTVWFAETTANKIGMIDTVSGTPGAPITVGSSPQGITYVPGGDIWFTETGAGKIGRINPTTHQLTEFATPTSTSGPLGITRNPVDGTIWFTEALTHKLGMFNPATITSSADIHEFTLPNAASSPKPVGIVYNPADGDLWFTEQGSNQIGKFDPVTQKFNSTAFVLPDAASNPFPSAITVDSDGNLWFAEPHLGKFNMLNPGTGKFAANGPYTLPASAGNSKYAISGITSGPDGRIWFTASGIGQIGNFDPVAIVQSTSPLNLISVDNTPNNKSFPYGIAPGPDGNLWFTEVSGLANGNGAIGVAYDTTLAMSTPTNITVGRPSR